MAIVRRPRLQLDIPDVIRDRAKAVAYGRGMTLVELVLHALTQVNDKELKKLAEAELKQRSKPGRPTH